VHLLLGNNANDRNIVAAFLAVDVIDDVSAPNDFVINAEHDDERKPDVDNNTNVSIFQDIDHVGSSDPLLISLYVP
jgi:hypothetical protein